MEAIRNTAQFKRHAERLIRQNHPDATGLCITWSAEKFEKPRKVKFPTGVTGYLGVATVSADGYRTARLHCNADSEGLMVR